MKLTIRIINTIRDLVAEKQQLVATQVAKPHDVVNVKQRMLQLELATELDHLSALLQTPETFADNFKQRCRDRATTNSIGIDQIPLSEANSLYWQIAMLLFQPDTMAKMLNILAPQVKTHLQISHSELITNSLKETAAKGLEPVFVFKDNLSFFNDPPEFSLLSNFIFCEKTLIDLRDIERFPLRTHAKLFEQLDTIDPKLCDQLYTHNNAFKLLKDDIAIFNRNGVTPKEALQSLMKGLIWGGTQMTGNLFATNPATEAISRFISFMEILPSDVKIKLLEVRGGSYTLGKIIDDELKQGTCVETAAKHLNEILETNKRSSLLNQSSLISAQGLKQIEKKYKQPINLRKEDPILKNLSIQFLKQALQEIKPESLIELVDLLLNLPTNLYDELLTNIQLTDKDDTFKTIAKLINQELLSIEQSDALSEIIIRYYGFNPINGLFWAIDTNKSAYVSKAIAFIPDQTNLAIDSGVLHFAATKSESFHIIFNSIPEHNRLPAIEINMHGQSVLSRAILTTGPLRTILLLYPAQKRLGILQKEELLHVATRNVESINTIFELLPEPDKLIAINLIDSKGNTLLHSAAFYPNSIKALLALFPAQERLSAVKVTNDNGSSVLHAAADNVDSLKLILNLYPVEEKLAAIQLKNVFGQTVLHYTAGNYDSLKYILMIYPEEQRLAAIQDIDSEGESVLHRAVAFSDSLGFILERFPAQNRLAVVQQKYNSTLTMLNKSLYYPKSFAAILLQIPINQWAELFKDINHPDYKKSINLTGMSHLYRKIALLKHHSAEAHGKIAEQLAEDLELKLSQFIKDAIKNRPDQGKIKQFKKEFIALATSQNATLHQHREIWGPILLNILIALTGIGLIAIASHAGYQAIKGYSDFNHLLFFAKTTSQVLEEDVEEEMHIRVSNFIKLDKLPS